jgi:cyanophycin synthetase
VDLCSRADVEAAYAVAECEGSGVICERFVRGVEHRLLVVGGKMLAAARGEEAWVTGDGHASVAELIDTQINSDPRRGLTEDYPLNMIRIEEDPAVALELERQGLSGESVPAEGRRVLIQRNGNVAFDCTEEVHPETAAIVVRAARCIGLDIAGIDLVAEDIAKPLGPQGGAIVEVNAGPGLVMHLRPAAGLPRPVGRAIVDYLFPDGADGRIPVVGIAGTRGKTRVARLLDAILGHAGRCVGLACSDGLFVERRPLAVGDSAHWGPAQRLLTNPEVEVAIIENGPEAMLREGLAYDRCQVGVITNIDSTQIPADGYVDSPERLCLLLRTQVDVVLPTGLAVLNAADPLVADMAPLCDGEVLFFAVDPSHPVLAAHLVAGGRAVSLRGWNLVLLGPEGSEVAVTRVATGQVDSLLAAVAAAWALGLGAEAIRDGLASAGV